MKYLSAIAIVVIGILIILTANSNIFNDLYYYEKIWFGILYIIVCSLISLATLKSLSISITDVLIIIYIIYSIVNILFCSTIAPDPLIITEWIILILLYLCVRLVCKSNTLIFIFLIVLSGLFQSVFGIMQFFGFAESKHVFFAATGSFMNSGPWGGYLSVCLSLALTCVLAGNLKRDFLFYFFWISIPIMSIALAMSNSRAAWLALMVVVVTIILTRLKTRKRKIKILKYAVLITLPILILLYKYKEDSAAGRLFIWKVSTNMILDKPIYGHGIQSFPSKYMLYQGEYFKQNPNDNHSIKASNNYYAFNEFIRIITEQGIIGLILFLLIVISVFISKDDKVAIKSGLISLLVFSFFSYPSDILPLKMLYPLFFGILAENSNKIYLFAKRPIVCTQVAMLFVLLSLLGFISIQKSRYDKSYRILDESHELSDIDNKQYLRGTIINDRFYVGMYSKKLFSSEQYEQCLPMMLQTSVFRPSSIVYCELGDTYKNIGFYHKAEEYYTDALFMTPGYIIPPYRLFILYVSTEAHEKAIDMAKYIIKMNVKVTNSITIKYKNEAKEYMKNIHKY